MTALQEDVIRARISVVEKSSLGFEVDDVGVVENCEEEEGVAPMSLLCG